MKNDVYVRLGERMNKFEGRYPLLDSYLKVLQTTCTEEEAEFASKFPDKSCTLRELANIYKKDESELSKLLETMARKGVIFNFTSETGDKKYDLNPILPGAMEYYILRRLDKPEKIKKYLELFAQMAVESKEYIDRIMEDDPEKAKTYLPSEPHFRTLTINEALPDKKEVYSYENVLEMVENQTSFAAMLCTCREGIGPSFTGPCRVEGVPRRHCLQFGRTAEFVLEQKIGDAKRITKQECKDIIKVCNKAGLVQNVNNFIDDLHFICNCCPCCCGIVQQVKMLGPTQSGLVEPTNFIPAVDERSCTGCGDCVDQCPVEAISLKDDVAFFNREGCLGCGFCATICPVECIILERVSNKKLELGDRKVGFGY